ncbi:3'-5' exonuclease [Streptomyces sp. NPDC005373]|uniref:3'-5' exonuclease n=1 Tax=Streptomyces sp. NPDC005373 TaxID=3156879 RepID=UPI0033B73311
MRRALASAQLTVPEQNTVAFSLISMHRSKGKESDDVVIAEGAHHSRLLDATWDEERIRANRRLLRVAITRARHMVVFVRPEDAVPLIPPSTSQRLPLAERDACGALRWAAPTSSSVRPAPPSAALSGQVRSGQVIRER